MIANRSWLEAGRRDKISFRFRREISVGARLRISFDGRPYYIKFGNASRTVCYGTQWNVVTLCDNVPNLPRMSPSLMKDESLRVNFNPKLHNHPTSLLRSPVSRVLACPGIISVIKGRRIMIRQFGLFPDVYHNRAHDRLLFAPSCGRQI